MTALRVASYNTRDFLDDRRAAARVVRSIDPDVLCLQEVPRRLLAGRRVVGFARECAMVWPGGHRGSGGTTILVRPGLILVGSRHHRLSTPRVDRTRGFAVVQVATGAAVLTVVSVHLSLKPGERARHAAAILEAVRSVPGPVVLAGDLNEGADGAAFQLLNRSLRDVGPGGPTYPVRRPRRRLDVILASAGVGAVPGLPVDLDEDDVHAASDHRPVWVDLAVGGTPGP